MTLYDECKLDPKQRDKTFKERFLEETKLLIPTNSTLVEKIRLYIDMVEGKVSFDNYFKSCKVCTSRFRFRDDQRLKPQYRSVCSDCKTSGISFCDKHNVQFTQYKCNLCDVEESRELYTESNRDSWIECSQCGLRGKALHKHYVCVHGMEVGEYEGMTTMSQDLLDRVSGERNPAWNHGGRLSPFSKNFRHYKSDEDYIRGLTSVLEKSESTKQKHPERQSTKIEFYLAQGMSEAEAKDALRKRQQTFNLDICIEKYGIEEGTKIWKDRQDRWQDTLNSKDPEEIKRINKAKMGSKYSISKAEKEIVTFLKEHGFDVVTQFPVQKQPKGCYLYDIVYGNKIIEYYGDFWHSNPKIYKADDVNKRTKVSARDRWELDRLKVETAKSAGYKVKIIWESDFNKFSADILQECVEFLSKEE